MQQKNHPAPHSRAVVMLYILTKRWGWQASDPAWETIVWASYQHRCLWRPLWSCARVEDINPSIQNLQIKTIQNIPKPCLAIWHDSPIWLELPHNPAYLRENTNHTLSTLSCDLSSASPNILKKVKWVKSRVTFLLPFNTDGSLRLLAQIPFPVGPPDHLQGHFWAVRLQRPHKPKRETGKI